MPVSLFSFRLFRQFFVSARDTSGNAGFLCPLSAFNRLFANKRRKLRSRIASMLVAMAGIIYCDGAID
jgi:hypothetical protein